MLRNLRDHSYKGSWAFNFISMLVFVDMLYRNALVTFGLMAGVSIPLEQPELNNDNFVTFNM